MRTLLQHSCAIDGGPHCLVLRRHSDPHPDVFFLIEMPPHLVSANPVAVQLLLPCLRCCCLICTSCLLCRECANPDAEQAVAFVSDLSSRLSLRSVHEAIGFAPNCFVLCRHPDPDCKGVFHRVVYTSISAQYPNQYANLAFPFSRITCCSTVAPSMARSANPAAALLHHRWRATLFRPKATLRSSSRRGFLIEMIPHLIVLNIPMSIQTWLCLRLSLKLQTML